MFRQTLLSALLINLLNCVKDISLEQIFKITCSLMRIATGKLELDRLDGFRLVKGKFSWKRAKNAAVPEGITDIEDQSEKGDVSVIGEGICSRNTPTASSKHSGLRAPPNNSRSASISRASMMWDSSPASPASFQTP